MLIRQLSRRLVTTALLVSAVTASTLGCAQDVAATNARLDVLATELQALKGAGLDATERQQQADALVARAAEELDFDSLTFDQISSHLSAGGALYDNNALRLWVFPRLQELAQVATLTGARAASFTVTYFPKTGDTSTDEGERAHHFAWADAYKAMLEHPVLGQLLLLDENISTEPFGRLQFLKPDVAIESGLFEAMIPLLDMPVSQRSGSSARLLFKFAADPGNGLPAELQQRVREKAVALYERTFPIAEERSESIQQFYAFLNGRFALGTLMNQPAPALTFDWVSSGDATSLADFTGKVVVVDWWATWCGPCIGSFENMRRLRERYRGYNVEFVGVTSLQGYHSDGITRERETVDADTEIRLMPEFMAQTNMTWLVAFSPQGDFNADFGVTGLPHVAIVDPAGVVRYNMLRPYEPPYLEAQKIDGLLKAAGLPLPATPMEEGNWSTVTSTTGD